MATTYHILIETYDQIVHSDTINSNLRKELESLETDEEFGLGHRVGTWSDHYYENDPNTKVRYYYYHNGRIRVTTNYNQLTYSQRTGKRSH